MLYKLRENIFLRGPNNSYLNISIYLVRILTLRTKNPNTSKNAIGFYLKFHLHVAKLLNRQLIISQSKVCKGKVKQDSKI